MRMPAEIVARLRRPYEGRRVLITGGAGFIGGHLLDALVSLGAVVRVIDDLSNSTARHVAEMVDLDPDRVRFVHGSILDDDAVIDAASDCSVIFHLAAIGSVPKSIAEPQRTWSVNATGTVRVLEAARKARAQRVVYAASSSAYGDDPGIPKVESSLPRPRSPYAASKLAGESLCAAWSASYGLSTVALRYFNVFGPRQPGDSPYSAVVAAFAHRLLSGGAPIIHGDGQHSRDFTPVANAVLATLLAGGSDRPLAGEAINVGTGRRVTIAELATTMAGLCKANHLAPQYAPERAGDVRHSLADISRARELLGYEIICPFEQGLEETIAWHRQSLAEVAD